MSRADELRKEADKQNASASLHLKTLDPEKPLDAHLLGVLAAVKATVFLQAAELHDAIERIALTGPQKALSRQHRLRMAAIRGDDKALQDIEQEIIDEYNATRNTGNGNSTAGS